MACRFDSLLLLLLLTALAGGQETAPDEPPEVAAPTLAGLWILRSNGQPEVPGPVPEGTPEALTEYLEIFGTARYIYRDNNGHVAAGRLEVTPPRLTLTARGILRVFVYELRDDELHLTPDAQDRPQSRGDLSRMSPHGSRTAIYRRRGASGEAWSLPLDDVGRLAGTYRMAPVEGRDETLRLLIDGRFEYEGPRGMAAAGRYWLADGVLVLNSGRVTRRLVPRLAWLEPGWVLHLGRADDDNAQPFNDLADMPPSFRREASWTRDAVDAEPEAVLGVWEAVLGGVPHRLVLEPGGIARYRPGDGAVFPCRWTLAGGRLTIELHDGLALLASRRFEAERLPEGLLLIPATNDQLSNSPLDDLPPRRRPFTIYTKLDAGEV